MFFLLNALIYASTKMLYMTLQPSLYTINHGVMI